MHRYKYTITPLGILCPQSATQDGPRKPVCAQNRAGFAASSGLSAKEPGNVPTPDSHCGAAAGFKMSFLTKIMPKKRPQSQYAEASDSSSRPSRLHDGRRNTGLSNSTLSVPSALQSPTSCSSVSTTQSNGYGRSYNGPRLDGAVKWLRMCRGLHHSCGVAAGYRPTRLIDLGEKFDLKRARLVDAEDGEEIVDYLTLSYCWGNGIMPEAAVTRLATLQERKERIRRGKLPRTFRHFFEIARLLDVRYVWIDSLCIIQDSLDDWQNETSFMGRIYANSLCTIAAESAKDCQGGIWLEARIRMLPNSTNTSPAYDDMTQEDNLRNYLSVCDQRFYKSPLQSRGWAVQEREVSPRVLHFTFAHVFWECREMRCHGPVLLGESNEFVGSAAGIREAGVEWKGGRLRTFDVPSEHRIESHPANSQNQVISISTFTKHLPAKQEPGTTMLLAWRTLIENFSARNFSRNSDRLPALWGLIFELQQRLPPEHQAAIWGADPLGLLWTIQDNVSSGARVQDVGPSWSWAAFHNPITYHHIHDILEVAEEDPYRPAAKILTLGTDFWGNDPEGLNAYSGLSIQCRARWVHSMQEFQETGYGFFREDCPNMPMYELLTLQRVLLVRILAFQKHGSFALALRATKGSKETVFVRMGVVSGIENQWFEGGSDNIITIV